MPLSPGRTISRRRCPLSKFSNSGKVSWSTPTRLRRETCWRQSTKPSATLHILELRYGRIIAALRKLEHRHSPRDRRDAANLIQSETFSDFVVSAMGRKQTLAEQQYWS